mgnify:CR=1 FL=1
MQKHPGYKILFRCDPHLAQQFIASVPVWCTRMTVEVKLVSTKRIKHEVEVEFETRWDANEHSLEAIKQRLTATKPIRNVRIVPPAVKPK